MARNDKSRLDIDFNKFKTIENIRSTSKGIIEDKSNSNEILEMMPHLNDENYEVARVAREELKKVFIWFLKQKDMIQSSESTTPITKFSSWLRNCYGKTKNSLFCCLNDAHLPQSQKDLIFEHLMELLISEAKYPYQIDINSIFPFQFFKAILSELASARENKSLIIDKFRKYLEYDDIKYYTLKAMHHILMDYKEEKTSSETFVRNVFRLLSILKLQNLANVKRKINKLEDDEKISNTETDNLFCKTYDETFEKFKFDYDKAADLFATVWLLFLSTDIPLDMYIRILITMDKDIMPHFRNPLTLSDFLIDSYSVGGSVSLLSLSSLFILIQKCNLEYPEFYSRFYQLIEPEIVYEKYRARFFFWADVFLTSSHLPAYIVAAFIKKLCRISLYSPIDAILIMVPLIKNLFIRHPNLKIMFKSTKCDDGARSEDCLKEDPFLFDEVDFKKCHAMESSVWELKTLQSHWSPKVREICSFDLPEKESNISDILETNFEDLVNIVTSVLDSNEIGRIDKEVITHVHHYLY